MCTSHIPGFPQSITDRTEMLHWHKINMFLFGSGKKDYRDVTEQHVGDQCAQWSLGFSLGIHRFPKRDHCNLNVMCNFCLFVCILEHSLESLFIE